jgi:NADPH:quinone reductase
MIYTGEIMKAIRVYQFGSPDVMVMEEMETPNPANNQVLINVKAIGINPVETYVRAGTYPILPQLPFIPGKNAAGIIAAVGSDITLFKPGDRVYCSASVSGTYAEKILCEEGQIYSLPDNIPFEAGAAIGIPAATAWRALVIRGGALAGESVFIHGASGSVGLNAIQIAKDLGLTVYGSAGTEAGFQLIKDMGADFAFNHKSENYIDEIKNQTNNQGFNLILENLANLNLAVDLELLAPKGRVIIIGSRGKIEIDPRATMGKETEIRGLALFAGSAEEQADTHSGLLNLLKKGALTPVISKTLSLSDAPKAHEMVMQDGNCGKIILKIP